MDFDAEVPVNRPTWAEIDLAALVHNFRALHSLLERAPGPDQSRPPRLIPVVKADAYGHGSVPVARVLAAAGVDILAVALVEEGVVLRRAGIATEILILEGAWEGQEEDLAAHALTAVVHTPEGVLRLDAAAQRRGTPVRVHAKIDTGMARLGAPWDRIGPFIDALVAAPHLELAGTFTHLACAEEEDRSYTAEQVRRFGQAVAQIRARSLDPGEFHVANSAGLLHWPSLRSLSARPGIALYGYPSGPCDLDLRPVMMLKSRIGCLCDLAPGNSVGYNRRFTASRPMRAATVPVGYADGYRRDLTGRGRVIVRDRYADLLGAVSMDMIVVDVTALPDVRIGEEVILMGSSPRCRVDAADWAAMLGTIPYEILCGIGPRVPRRVLGPGSWVLGVSHKSNPQHPAPKTQHLSPNCGSDASPQNARQSKVLRICTSDADHQKNVENLAHVLRIGTINGLITGIASPEAASVVGSVARRN